MKVHEQDQQHQVEYCIEDPCFKTGAQLLASGGSQRCREKRYRDQEAAHRKHLWHGPGFCAIDQQLEDTSEVFGKDARQLCNTPR